MSFSASSPLSAFASLIRLGLVCGIIPLAACSYGGGSSGSSADVSPAEQAQDLQVARLIWGPASGPVVAYDIQVSRNDGAYSVEQSAAPTQEFQITGSVGDTFRVRVAGVDSEGNRGPVSAESDKIVFTENGPAVAQASTEAATTTAQNTSFSAAAAVSPDDTADSDSESDIAVAVRGDIDGDGAADLLWVSPDGIMTTRLDGDALATLSESAAPIGWESAGFGDFDGDGQVDLLWTAADGGLAFSSVTDSNSGLVSLGVLEADETVAAVGDLDGNGVSDLVVFASDSQAHSWWKLDPDNGPSIHALDQPEGATLAASGDFDGDATSDLLWLAGDGSLQIDFIEDGAVTGIMVVSNAGDSALAAADFDGNGIDDVLYRDSSGTLGVWSMGNRQAPQAAQAPLDAGEGWTVVAAADYDGNGNADVLWASEDSRVLRLDGAAEDLPIDAGSQWALVPAGR